MRFSLNTYAEHRQPCTRSMVGLVLSPHSTARSRRPDRRVTYRVRKSGRPAGNISAGERKEDLSVVMRVNPFLDELDLASDELCDEANAERNVSECSRRSSHRTSGEILERKTRPNARVAARGNVSPLVRMPYRGAIAIVLEPLEHLEPVFISSQEPESRHCLEPHERKWNVRLHCVSVRKPVAEDEVRHVDNLFSDQLL